MIAVTTESFPICGSQLWGLREVEKNNSPYGHLYEFHVFSIMACACRSQKRERRHSRVRVRSVSRGGLYKADEMESRARTASSREELYHFLITLEVSITISGLKSWLLSPHPHYRRKTDEDESKGNEANFSIVRSGYN